MTADLVNPTAPTIRSARPDRSRLVLPPAADAGVAAYFTGGVETEVGGYRIHTFTSSGTLVYVGDGTPVDCEVLVVAGGGGGGNAGEGGGGGGAGGVKYNAALSIGADQTITVGAGGAGAAAANTHGTKGGNSSIGALLVAEGGGAGGGGWSAGGAGGSGGGGRGVDQFNSAPAGGAGSAGQGNNGGNGVSHSTSSARNGAGGGGAGAAAANAGAFGAGTAGGVGGAHSITGVSTYYGGGGGGAHNLAGDSAAGAGGLGGGGRGGRNGATNTPTAGRANTGGGGGGADDGTTAPAGGSGVVIVRYPIADAFDPTDIAWRNYWWANTLPLADAATVLTWPGGGSTPQEMVTTSASTAPVFETASADMNSKPTVIFDGSNDYLVAANLNAVARPFELVMIGRVKAGNSNGDRIIDGGANLAVLVDGDNKIQLYAGSVVTSTFDADTDGNQPHLFRFAFPSATGDTRVFVDEVDKGGASAGTLGINDLAIGGTIGGASTASLEVAFVGLTTTALTTQEKADLLAWAQAYYGV